MLVFEPGSLVATVTRFKWYLERLLFVTSKYSSRPTIFSTTLDQFFVALH